MGRLLGFLRVGKGNPVNLYSRTRCGSHAIEDGWQFFYQQALPQIQTSGKGFSKKAKGRVEQIPIFKGSLVAIFFRNSLAAFDSLLSKSVSCRTKRLIAGSELSACLRNVDSLLKFKESASNALIKNEDGSINFAL